MSTSPIGRRGVAVAALLFAVSIAVRGPGIFTPHTFAFDEFLYVPAAGRYISGTDPHTEPAHPPLFKELASLAIRAFGGIHVKCRARAPSRDWFPVATDGSHIAWLDSGRMLHAGDVTSDCAVHERHRLASPLDVARVALVGARAYATDKRGDLRAVGGGRTLARGVGDVVGDGPDDALWATLPSQRLVERISTAGEVLARIRVHARPLGLAAIVDDQAGNTPHAYRLVVREPNGTAETIDPYGSRVAFSLDHLGTGETTATTPSIIWSSSGRTLSAIEATSLAHIGTVTLHGAPRALVSTPFGAGVADKDGFFTVFTSGMLPSARAIVVVFGALAVAMTALLALRVTGSLAVAATAGAILVVDPMQQTLSRLALPDMPIVFLTVAAWFCVLSAKVSRSHRFAWLVGTAVCCGSGASVKWNGAWPLFGIAAFLAWDLYRNGDDALLRCAGASPMRVLAVAAGVAALVPVVYVLTFIPNGLANIVAQHRAMLRSHIASSYTYFESPWYQWAFGARAFRLWATPATRAIRVEMWLIPNAALAVSSSIAVAWAAVTRHDRALRVIALAAAAEVVPWFYVPRATLVYHSAELLPFGAIALAALLWRGLRAGWLQRAVVVAVVSVVLFVSVQTWPLANGTRMPQARITSLLARWRFQIDPPSLPWGL